MTNHSFDDLEKKMHAALRGQPVLRAPSTLEQRVREEIARRAARPWWQRSFGEWPALPRGAFFALSGCAGCVSMAVALQVLNGPGAEMAASFLQKVATLHIGLRWVVATLVQLFAGVSPMGWYLMAAIFIAACAGLLGIGATAYRLLWKSR